MKEYNTIALKEWAVAIDALEAGEQIILMRKGGIIEETRDFELKSNAFFLFPTYEHQKKYLLKDEYQPRIDQIVTAAPGETVLITSYAEVVQDLEVNSQEELERLYPVHIWTEHFAEERLKWKRAKPLHVLVLRVYKLTEPIVLPILAEYDGCKSWIDLDFQLKEGVKAVAVLTDEEFSEQFSQIVNLIAE